MEYFLEQVPNAKYFFSGYFDLSSGLFQGYFPEG